MDNFHCQGKSLVILLKNAGLYAQSTFLSSNDMLNAFCVNTLPQSQYAMQSVFKDLSTYKYTAGNRIY